MSVYWDSAVCWVSVDQTPYGHPPHGDTALRKTPKGNELKGILYVQQKIVTSIHGGFKLEARPPVKRMRRHKSRLKLSAKNLVHSGKVQ